MNHSIVRILLALVVTLSLTACAAVAPAATTGDAAAPAEATVTVAVPLASVCSTAPDTPGSPALHVATDGRGSWISRTW